MSEFSSWSSPPGPGIGQQTNADPTERHQLWTSDIGFPDPLVYLIRVQVNTHSFTSSQVLPINSLGQPTKSFDEFGKLGLTGKNSRASTASLTASSA